MNWSAKSTKFVCTVGILLFLVGCGQATSTTNNTGSAITLQITRRGDLQANRFPAFTKTVNDAAKTSQLYDAIQRLPVQNAFSCAIGNGLRYDLVFTRPKLANVSIELEALGCQSAVLAPADRRATNPAFWSLVAQILGVTQNELFIRPV